MLVLDRKQGQDILIDGPARIVIIRTAGGRVKIGIEADRKVKVLRGELLNRKETAT